MTDSERDGHVITLQGQQYMTYKGVLWTAHEVGLESLRTRIIQVPCPDNEYVAIVEAEARMKDGRVFMDVADASPKNVNQRLSSALIRLASTRAKGRTLRDAVNIGETLAEELPEHEEQPRSTHPARQSPEVRREAVKRDAPKVHASADAQRTEIDPLSWDGHQCCHPECAKVLGANVAESCYKHGVWPPACKDHIAEVKRVQEHRASEGSKQ